MRRKPSRGTIVGGDVIELGGGLVVPTAPGVAAIYADGRALVRGDGNDLRVFGAYPDALIVVAAGRALPAHESFSGICGFPRSGIGDVEGVWIVRGNSDAHRAGATTADAMIGVDELPGFACIVGAIDAGLAFLRLEGEKHALRIAWRDSNSDAREAIFSRGQTCGDWPPGAAAIGGLVQAAAGDDEGFAAANFPGSDARSPESREESLRVAGIHDDIGGAGVFVLIQNLLECLASIERTENTAFGVRAVGVPLGCHKYAIRIFRIDDDSGDLLRIVEAKVRPGLARVRGFVNPVADRKVRPLQSFPAAGVNNVGVRGRHGQSADRAGGLIIEDGIPCVAKIVGLPDAAIHGRHVENSGLARHAGDRHCAAAAERSDAAPAHLGEKFLVVLLGGKREQRQD